MKGRKNGLALFAHDFEVSPQQGDPLHARRSGALTKQREHHVPFARLVLGKAVILLTLVLPAVDAVQWTFHPTISSKKLLRAKVAVSHRSSNAFASANFPAIWWIAEAKMRVAEVVDFNFRSDAPVRRFFLLCRF
jgi:hypothetical protein